MKTTAAVLLTNSDSGFGQCFMEARNWEDAAEIEFSNKVVRVRSALGLSTRSANVKDETSNNPSPIAP